MNTPTKNEREREEDYVVLRQKNRGNSTIPPLYSLYGLDVHLHRSLPLMYVFLTA